LAALERYEGIRKGDYWGEEEEEEDDGNPCSEHFRDPRFAIWVLGLFKYVRTSSEDISATLWIFSMDLQGKIE
jgi:hypothetical protein